MPDRPVPVPPDDLSRELTIARPDHDQSLPHVGLVGDTYTILVTGAETAGKYTLIDMHVPPGGGPPPHRHDFEEMFTVLEGEVRVTFRDQTLVARAGETINVPANAPHAFTNAGDKPSRLLCMCAPAGQEEFFTLVGQPVPNRTQAPPPLDAAAEAAFVARAQELAPRYKTELLPPPDSRPADSRPADDPNQRTIAEFRANGGQVGGDFAGAPLLLLHTVGARSGQPRVNPVMYLADGDRYLVFASKAGSDRNPDWYWNLRANPDVTIEVGEETIAVHATELTGAERDEKYRVQAERYPGFADYERKTSRVIPVVALSRRAGGAS